jgi:glycolate oxidase iron-sulfur subunit
VGNIERVAPDVIAAGNIGCIMQIAAGTAIPVVHTVELIDWATGGRKPEALVRRDALLREVPLPAAPGQDVLAPGRSVPDMSARSL